LGPTERRPTVANSVLLDELTHLIDRLDAVQVAVALGVPPCEESVAAEHETIAARIRVDCPAQHQRQLEAGTLPGDPDEPPPEGGVELLQLASPVRARGEGDRPVGMQMVHMIEGQQGVERRVDRWSDEIVTECAQRIERNHLVLARFAAVLRGEALELVEVQQRESGTARRPEISTASLDGKDTHRLACQRVGQLDLRARIAAAEVRDPKIGTEKIRAIAQHLQRVGRERGSFAVIPQVLEELGFDGRRFRQSINSMADLKGPAYVPAT